MENCIDEKIIQARVVDIKWERIIVHLYVEMEYSNAADEQISLSFYAVNGLNKAKAVFCADRQRKMIHLSMNITNPGDCQCLKMGTYSIVVCDKERILAKCIVDTAFFPLLDDCSRSFLHNGRTKSFFVNFCIAENEEELPLLMYVMDAGKIPVKILSNRELLKNLFVEPIRELTKNFDRIYWKFLYHHYVKKYRKEKNVVLFMTEQSRVIGGNLQAVYNRMIERGMDDKYNILLSARPASYEEQTRKSTKALLKKVAKSRLIIIDDHVPVFDWLQLCGRTSLVQLWHAGAGFKSSGYSRWGHPGCPAPISCHRQYKYGIAGSKYIGKFFAEVFGINEEQILPTGMPRMDRYLDKDYQREKIAEIYIQYPICKGKKVILFAPTYRGRGRANAYYPYEMIDFERLHEFCGDNYVVLFKMHPWVKQMVPIEEGRKDRFVDVSAYSDINDLFYITDFLITDYSSNIFEFSLMHKPMLFYAFDKIQYAYSRGFHRDYEVSAPGKVCYTFGQLIDAMEREDFEYEKVQDYIEKHFDYIDSNASDRVIDWILLDKLPNTIKKRIHQKETQFRKMHKLDFSSLKE